MSAPPEFPLSDSGADVAVMAAVQSANGRHPRYFPGLPGRLTRTHFLAEKCVPFRRRRGRSQRFTGESAHIEMVVALGAVDFGAAHRLQIHRPTCGAQVFGILLPEDSSLPGIPRSVQTNLGSTGRPSPPKAFIPSISSLTQR